MHISIHTDNHIQGREDVAQTVQGLVEEAVSHFSEWLTRIDVHLSDENGSKGGNDKRCLIDAHPKGSSNIAAHHTAATVRDAIEGAIDKLTLQLEKIHDKRIDRQHRPGPIVIPETATEE